MIITTFWSTCVFSFFVFFACFANQNWKTILRATLHKHALPTLLPCCCVGWCARCDAMVNDGGVLLQIHYSGRSLVKTYITTTSTTHNCFTLPLCLYLNVEFTIDVLLHVLYVYLMKENLFIRFLSLFWMCQKNLGIYFAVYDND